MTRVRNEGGDREVSGGVNTETGVWQGTMIRFINQAMIFCLLGGLRQDIKCELNLPASHYTHTFPFLLSCVSSPSPLPLLTTTPSLFFPRVDFLPCGQPRWIGPPPPPPLPRPLAATQHPIFSPAGVELSTLGMGLLRWSELLARCPGTIFLHLRVSVLLPIL